MLDVGYYVTTMFVQFGSSDSHIGI